MAVRVVDDAPRTEQTPADRLADAIAALAAREQPAPQVTVHPPNMSVTIPEGAVQVRVEPTPAPHVTVNPGDTTINLPESLEVRSEPVQMIAPESMPPTTTDPELIERLERLEESMKPKVRRIERDENGRMVRVVEEVA